MARIPLIEKKENLGSEHHPLYDSIAQSRGRVQGPFSVLLHSPTIAERTAHLGAYIRFESKLDPKVIELAALAAARELGCKHEWAAHIAHAQKAGIGWETIRAIHRGALEDLDAHDMQLVSYARQLLRSHQVSEETFQAMQRRLGVDGLVELTATIGYYAMLACTLNAFDVAHVTPPEELKI
ncbi:MAG: carboxymuconolactone decarboxylase family protein [Candidatus Binatia bacterium]